MIEFPLIGPILFKRQKRSKYLKLCVEPFSLPRVSMPWWASYEEAKNMVRKNLSWLEQQIKSMKVEEERSRKTIKHLPQVSSKQAKLELTLRLELLAYKHGFEFNRVFIRNQKTVWGSCSEKNNINLNQRLVFLPQALQDYVILHELVHTRVKNHQKEFWTALEGVFPGAKKADKQLKSYGELLYGRHAPKKN